MKTILLFAGVALFFFFTGCGKGESKKVYSTPEGKVEVTQNKDGKTHEMTIKSEKGTATMKVGAGTVPEDLGVPIYPGVEAEESGTWSMTGMGKEGSAGFSSTMLFSKDPFDKVSGFYKDKLKGRDPKVFEMAMPTGKMLNMSIEEGETSLNIVLTENKEKQGTNIQITKAKK